MPGIVVGFDGSDESKDALRLARAFADLRGAELVVVAVFPDPFPALGAALPQAFEEEESAYFADTFAEVDAEVTGPYVRKEVTHVSAAQGLHDVAEEGEADMIVLGSTHRGTVGRVMPGSVGERLLGGAPCAVAVAPRGFARGEHFGLGLVGVAYNGTDESQVALAEAKRLADELDGRLKVIAIVPTKSPGPLRAPFMETLREHFRKALDDATSKLGGAAEVDAVLEEGDPAAVLAMHGVELDLLVIGSRGYGPLRHTLLGGVSAEVMRTAPCPVLVVPRAAGR